MPKEIWMINRDNICHASCDGCDSDIGTNTCTVHELSQFWANEAQRKLLEYLITQEVKLPLVGSIELQIVDIRLIKDMLKQLEIK